jgi:KipI family sensor histidine kinase inhibitor
MRFTMCGDAAFTVHFGDRANVLLTRSIAGVHDALQRSAPAGYVESVPGLTSLMVLFDPAVTSAAALEEHVLRCVATNAAVSRAREWRLPVCYDGECAPDLAEVAAACGLSAEQAIEIHCARSYVVYVVGFSPGFPYMGDVDERLALPRRAEPRPRVPAGSVAIATRYTAIYPQATAGGWHIIGRTPVRLFDPSWPAPALCAPGDTVRFHRVDESRFDSLAREAASEPTSP